MSHEISIKTRHLVVIVVSLTFLPFAYCIINAFLNYSFQNNRSHCNVWNFAPSMSAAISYTPNREIWQIGVLLDMLPRFLLLMEYRYLLQDITHRLHYIQNMINVACLAHIFELSCLVLVTFVDGENRFHSLLHRFSFGGFIVFSIIYFGLHVYLFRNCLRIKKEWSDHWSLTLKKYLLILYLISVSACMLTFWRHVNYCEPGMFSAFAILEYSVIIFNIGFHATAYFDFYYKTIKLDHFLGLIVKNVKRCCKTNDFVNTETMD